MLEDYIETNRLSARIVKTKKNTQSIVCAVFLADNNPVLAIHFSSGSLSAEKIKQALVCEELSVPTDKEVFEITGYESGFVPPISIFEIKVLLDKKLLSPKTLSCPISETHSLEISPREIQEQNEDSVVGEFSR